MRGKAEQGALVQALAHPDDSARDEHVEDTISKCIAFVAVAVKENVHRLKLFFWKVSLILTACKRQRQRCSAQQTGRGNTQLEI